MINLDIDLSNLNNLESKVDKLDVDKLVLVFLSKLSNIVKKRCC